MCALFALSRRYGEMNSVCLLCPSLADRHEPLSPVDWACHGKSKYGETSIKTQHQAVSMGCADLSLLVTGSIHYGCHTRADGSVRMATNCAYNHQAFEMNVLVTNKDLF